MRLFSFHPFSRNSPDALLHIHLRPIHSSRLARTCCGQDQKHAGRLFLAYGYSSQAYDLFLATELSQGETQLDAEELGLVAKPFKLQLVEDMIRDGTIKDATTVAAFGLLKLKGLL